MCRHLGSRVTTTYCLPCQGRAGGPLKTSRAQVDRLLDPTRDVTLTTLQRAAALVGRKVQISSCEPVR